MRFKGESKLIYMLSHLVYSPFNKNNTYELYHYLCYKNEYFTTLQQNEKHFVQKSAYKKTAFKTWFINNMTNGHVIKLYSLCSVSFLRILSACFYTVLWTCKPYDDDKMISPWYCEVCKLMHGYTPPCVLSDARIHPSLFLHFISNSLIYLSHC